MLKFSIIYNQKLFYFAFVCVCVLYKILEKYTFVFPPTYSIIQVRIYSNLENEAHSLVKRETAPASIINSKLYE